MSGSIMVDVVCDACGKAASQKTEPIDASGMAPLELMSAVIEELKITRAAAKKFLGWNGGGASDYCAECRQRRAALAKEEAGETSTTKGDD